MSFCESSARVPLSGPGDLRRLGWWVVGALHGAVGESDGEFPVEAEFDDPALVMNLVVVSNAHGQEVVEVGSAPVTPPDDVMQLAPVVVDAAAGDRTRRVPAA